MGNNCTFLGEALHMLCLTSEEALRDKQWEIGVLDAELLEFLVELALDLFPYSVAVRLYNHAAANRRGLCQVGFHHQVVVPLGVVLRPLSQLFQFFCHLLLLHYI